MRESISSKVIYAMIGAFAWVVTKMDLSTALCIAIICFVTAAVLVDVTTVQENLNTALSVALEIIKK